jgi:hypothetical protein
MVPTTESKPLDPGRDPLVDPGPPAPTVTRYVVPVDKTSCDSADDPPPEFSPRTDER